MNPAVPVVDLDALDPTDRVLVGGKAAGLGLMIGLGLRVPPGFVVTTSACRQVRAAGELPAVIAAEVDAAVARLAPRAGWTAGAAVPPRAVAVRSGAPASMPGMMDTVLDVEVDVDRRGGARLHDAIVAVARSWDGPRAVAYRRLHDLDDEPGTAVVVQAMVGSGLTAEGPGPASGAGVAFSRDPTTGVPGLCGDYLPGGRGEDVVGGARTTQPLAALAAASPDAHAQLADGVAAIERALRDLVDVEFVVEHGVVHFLQCRVGTRAAAAAVRIAVDLVDEGVLEIPDAVARVSPGQLALAARAGLDLRRAPEPIARGIGASPGVATGRICLSPDRVDEVAAAGDGVVLVRTETSPADLAGMASASGLLTTRGGLVSHAAVVARELDLPAVVGAVDLEVGSTSLSAGPIELAEGALVTIDGSTGAVYAGAVPTVAAAHDRDLERLRRWTSG
jgi:pyruvate,orthophosphate dikinase